MNASLKPVILTREGGSARLEPLGIHHAASLARAASDASIWRYIPPPYGGASDLDSMKRLIDRALAAQEAGTELPFAIVAASSGEAIGSTRYMDVQPGNRSLEIGATWLGPAWQRTPINTECKFMLLRHAFESIWPGTDDATSGTIRVQLKCDARNVRSQGAILRIGARYEGTLRKHRVLPDGFVRDTAYFSIVRDEWAGVKAMLIGMMDR